MTDRSVAGARNALGLVILLLGAAAALRAQEVRFAAPQPRVDVEKIFDPEPVIGAQHALVLCSLSGDPEHHKAFSELVTKLCGVLKDRLGVPKENLIVLFGDEPDDTDGPLVRDSKRATREELDAAVKQIRESLAPADTLWVIVLGHSHFDGRYSWLNLQGPDIQQTEFGKLFEGLASQQQIFLITTPTSGQYVKPLSAANRVVITATESDWETNETEFPGVFVNVFASPPAAKELDLDRDGRLTLFDLYVATCRTLAQSYLDRMFLATEHPQLDDNGDGRATELQIDYLSEDLGGRVRRGRIVPPVVAPQGEGFLAKSIVLPLTPPPADAAPAEKSAQASTEPLH